MAAALTDPPCSRPQSHPWFIISQTYQRVRANRQVRLRAKKRRSGRGDEGSGHTCPVCGDRVSAATPEDMHAHVETCLRRVSGSALLGRVREGAAWRSWAPPCFFITLLSRFPST